MDYTKYLNSNHKFKLFVTDPKVSMAQDIMKEMQSSTILLSNFIRLELKFDIDEYIAYFLKDKNEFLSEFEKIISKSKFSNFKKSNYANILSIINGRMNKILSDYKFIKQKLLTKLSKKEKFYRIKDTFLKANSSNKEVTNKGDRSSLIITNRKLTDNQGIVQINSTFNEEIESDSKYSDADNVLNTFKKQETDTLSDTKKMIFELSDLMTSFSTKVHEQQEITNIIYSNSKSSLDNVKDGNKELGISLEAQKNRGLYIGLIFILMGFFLLFYDYTL